MVTFLLVARQLVMVVLVSFGQVCCVHFSIFLGHFSKLCRSTPGGHFLIDYVLVCVSAGMEKGA